MKKRGFTRHRHGISYILILLLSFTLFVPSYGITTVPIRTISPPASTTITPPVTEEEVTVAPGRIIMPQESIKLPLILVEYEYKVTNGAATITKYHGSEAHVTIPATLGGYPVKTIGFNAFGSNKTLESVIIPEGITRLDDMSFYKCYNLASVTLPGTLTEMKGEVFASCPKLTGVALPDSLVTLDPYSFHNSGIKTLTLPKSVKDYMRLVYANNLEAIDVAPENPYYSSIDGVLYSKDKKNLIQYPVAKTGTAFTVPEGVDYVYPYAFFETKHLQEITIPASVKLVCNLSFNEHLTSVSFLGSETRLGASCFWGCTALTNVTLPANLKTIPTDTFKGCSSLKKLTLPGSVGTIESGAFAQCINLTDINLPTGLTEIQSYTFNGCKSLPAITIPATVQVINNGAFTGCSNLSSITIPASVQKIGKDAYKQCTSLKDARFLGNGPAVGEGIFSYAASGFTIYYPQGKEGWTTPYWYGYRTISYAGLSDLPAITLRAPLALPIPSTSDEKPDFSKLRPTLSLDLTFTPTPDEAPDLLPPGTPPATETAPPANEVIPPSTGTGSPSGASEIRLYLGKSSYMVNGQSQGMDASPILMNGRILLPVRYVAVPLGASTQWDPQGKKVTVTLDNTVIELWIDNNMAKVNGVEKMIDPGNPDVKPIIVNPGRTMLPLRFLGESLGCDINWNQTLQEATLTKGK